MSVELESATRLAALRDKANATTGENADTLAGAVDALIDGYRQGGGSGNEEITEPHITFYDYDGTVVAVYTLDEVAKLSELPTPPAHDGLVFQEWNWSLDGLKACTRSMDVGALYDTVDGKTRVHITIEDERYLRLALNVAQSEAYDCVIDWGDGSETETFANTNYGNYVIHTYPQLGDYVITIDSISGTHYFEGSDNQSGNYMRDILSAPYKINNGNKPYEDAVREVYLGRKCTQIACRSVNLRRINIHKNVTQIKNVKYAEYVSVPAKSMSKTSFIRCYGLKKISLPEGITSIKSNLFLQCNVLSAITIPESVTSLGDYCFDDCRSLTEIIIPESVTSIGNYCFRDCRYLKKVTLPNGLLTLGNYCFYNCYKLDEITIPDTVTSLGTYCFENCSGLAEIIIPESVTSIGQRCFYGATEAIYITLLPRTLSIGNNAFYMSNNNLSSIKYYDFTRVTVTDGVLSYTFETNTLDTFRDGTLIMFATAEIAEVAKATTNLAQYADKIHYVGEEGIEWL